MATSSAPMGEIEIVRSGDRLDTLRFVPDGPDEEDDENRGYDVDRYEPDDERLPSLPGSELRRLVDSEAALACLSTSCPIEWEGNHGSWGSHKSFLRFLLKRARPALRALELDAPLLRTPHDPSGPPELSHLYGGIGSPAQIEVGSLSKLWRVAPALEQLVVAQARDVSLGTIVAPRLRTLVVGCSASRIVKAIARATLPSLETLLVRVGSPADVKRLLGSRAATGLAHLGLIANKQELKQRGDEVLAALVAAPHLEQLVTLDLGGIDAAPESWRGLVKSAARFERLKELRLSSWRLERSELSEIDDELLDELEPRFSPRCRPRDEGIGRELEQSFPVRWLTTTLELLEEDVDGVVGYSENLSLDDWLEVERSEATLPGRG